MTGATGRIGRGNGRRAATATLAFALLGAVAPGAGAQPPIGVARHRAHALTVQVGDARTAVARLQTRILDLAGQVADARAALDRIQGRLVAAQHARAAAQLDLAGIRARLDERARIAFEELGPGASAAYLLGADSFADLMDRTVMLQRVQSADATLATRVQERADRLASETSALSRVAHARGRILAGIESRRVGLLRAFAEQQAALAQLAGARRDARRDVARIERQQALAAGALPFGDWAGRLLQRIGAPTCRDNLVAVVAWEANEFTAARWNPLATTHAMPGSTRFNPVGVQSYVSLEQGLQATEDTLTGGAASFGYAAILDSLHGCAGAIATAEAINASAWCRNCANGNYVVELVPIVEAYFDRYAGMHV